MMCGNDSENYTSGGHSWRWTPMSVSQSCNQAVLPRRVIKVLRGMNQIKSPQNNINLQIAQRQGVIVMRSKHNRCKCRAYFVVGTQATPWQVPKDSGDIQS